MKDLMRRGIALVLALLICIGLMPNLTLVSAAAGALVDYQYGSGQVIKNWGTRGEVATFLSPNAGAFYTGNNTYDILSAYAGGTGVSNAPSSPLYSALQNLMENAHTHETSYNETRDLYQYTDCQNNGNTNNGSISCFYSGASLGPAWDGGSTWNREHTWPNSKGLGGNDENDIMMLRPTASRVNTSRSNKAYGQSSGYYNPNSASNGSLDVRGDVARIFLYVYVRWGNVNGNGEYSTWGSNGVMESVDVLLDWIEIDPVDTWEMGRNDSVESITGTRNVFVDYPEFAFLLFGEEIPANITTPSGEGSSKCDHNNFASVVTPPTCIAQGYTTYTCQTAGCSFTYTANYTAVVAHNFVGGVCSVCSAEELGEMYIHYPAGGTYVSATVNTNKDKPTLDPSTTPVVWNVEKDTDGYYIFSVNGQYMTSGATGNSLTLSSELTDLARWEATEADGGVYLRNVGANYSGSYNQYLEFFESSFTTYGFNQSNSSIYTFRLVATGCQHTNKETIPAQEATCGVAGLTEGTECADCGVTLVAQQEVPATGNHNYVDNVCTVCGALLSTGEEVTISFADKANRTELTTEQQVWKQNGITVTNNKGESTSNVADYVPARFYKSSELIVAYPGMTTIVFHCNDYKDTYAADLASSIDTANGVTVTTSDKSVTVQFASAVNSFTIAKLAAQVRLDSIDIVAAGDAPSDCQHTNKETLPAQGATCGATGLTAGEKCKDCGKVLVAQETVPATGNHNYVNNVCTVCGDSLIPTAEVTITFDDEANRTKLTTEQQVWEQNGITVTNNKAASQNDVADYEKPARFYKSSELIIACPGMTQLVFHCNTATYATALVNSINTSSGETVAVDGKVVTVRLASAVDTFTIAKLAAQVRVDSIIVTAAVNDAPPVHQHTLTPVAKVDASCTTDGMEAHDKCSKCNKLFVNGVEKSVAELKIPAVHNLTPVAKVDASCTTDGMEAHDKCSKCGKLFVNGAEKTAAELKIAASHNLTPVAKVDASCTTDGMEAHDKCSKCGKLFVGGAEKTAADLKIAASHLLVHHDAKAPTCTEKGWNAYDTCSRCNYSTYEEISATDHSYTPVVTAPSCTEGGYTTYTCNCGASYVDNRVNPLDHNWDAGTVILEPTEEKEGQRKHLCDRCGESKIEPIPQLNHVHSYTASVVAPTCTENGYTVYTCACGHSYTADPTTAKGHSYGNWTVTKAATCTEKGQESRTCTSCGNTETREITAKGHSYTEKMTAPTCTEQGYTTYTCANCDHSYVSDYVAANGHKEVVDPAVAATCSSTGLTEGKHCSVCQTILVAQNTIPAKGHADKNNDFVCDVCGEKLCVNHTEEIIPGTAATCEQDGLTDGKKCANCGAILLAQKVIAALGHQWTEATCEAAKTCTVCGKTEGSAAGHLFGNDWEKDADRHWQICQVCGEKGNEAEHVPGDAATETTPQICTVCGEVLVPALGNPDDVLFGDANGDGVVNLKDLSRLRKYFAGNDVEIDIVCIDLNGDGVVNLKDLTRLRKYLAGDDITLGK